MVKGAVIIDIINLFLAFLRVGALSLGGGYILIPLIEQEAVQKYGWLTTQEFVELLGFTQVIPGAISVKFATFTGYKVGGLLGAAAANLGILLPPVVIILLLFRVLKQVSPLPAANALLQGVKFGTLGLLAAVTVNIGRALPLEAKGALITAAAFLAITLLKIHPGLAILGSGILGILLYVK